MSQSVPLRSSSLRSSSLRSVSLRSWCPKITYSPILAKILYILAFFGISLLIFYSEKTKTLITRENILFIPWAIVLVLYLISYYQNPIRLSSAKKCSKIKCSLYYAISASLSSTFGCLTLFLLMSHISSNTIFKIIICLVIWIVCMMFIWSIYSNDVIYEQNNFAFLPNFMACKHTRVLIYYVVVVLKIIALYQGYLNKSGVWNFRETKIAFILGIILVVVTMLLDYSSLNSMVTYDPENYDLPSNVQVVKKS